MTVLPDYAVPTGDFIEEWMEDAGINAAELSRRLGVSRKHVSELLGGKATLTPAVALKLERVTGVPARIWNQYEATYREDVARLAARDLLESQYEEAKTFPLSYLRKWNFITASSLEKSETVEQLLGLLGVGSLQAFRQTWGQASVAFRKAAVSSDKEALFATWLALGEREFRLRRDLAEFDRSKLEALLPELRRMTRHDDQLVAIREAVRQLEGIGVVVCLTPPIPGLGVYGATRWIKARPLIQLSMLRKSDDQFWFTLFHELGHVLLHGQERVFSTEDTDQAENEANEFAQDLLVPLEYRDLLPTGRSVKDIEELAEKIGVAPSIVLGQAQRQTKDFAWGHSLRVSFEWEPNTGGAPTRN